MKRAILCGTGQQTAKSASRSPPTRWRILLATATRSRYVCNYRNYWKSWRRRCAFDCGEGAGNGAFTQDEADAVGVGEWGFSALVEVDGKRVRLTRASHIPPNWVRFWGAAPGTGWRAQSFTTY
jgi:hypothetical protein